MLFLIDGYNLLHAAGLAVPKASAGQMRSARRRMLDWLADSVRQRAQLIVVFDGIDAPRSPAESSYRGIAVIYASPISADDWIENWLVDQPRSLAATLISNDRRLQVAAQRRGGPAWSCQQFVDWLIESDRPTTAEVLRPLPPLSTQENESLLAAFEQPKPKDPHPRRFRK